MIPEGSHEDRSNGATPCLLDATDPDAEGQYIGDELHSFSCPCPPCGAENARALPGLIGPHEDPATWWTRIAPIKREWFRSITARECDEARASLAEAWDGKLDVDGLDALRNANEINWIVWDREEADTRDLASLRHTLPLVAGDTAPVPALLTRTDGATLLYAGRLNSIFGEPGMGKSWVALMVLIEAVRSGARAVWWDFEDRPSTLAARLTALGAADLIEGERLLYATPTLAEDERGEVETMCDWLGRGQVPGLVVIDSVESAGLPTDSNNASPWFDKHVVPWLEKGVGVLLLDHVPKRLEDRPRGAIGSQHKLARISGAGLMLAGTPWTKTQGGQVRLVNHKDRPGDLPEPLNKTVAVVTVAHTEGGRLTYTIDPPDAEENAEDLSPLLLAAMVEAGPDGVRTSKGVRNLLKGRGRDIDMALEDLLKVGWVAKTKDGPAFVYTVTAEGEIEAEDVHEE